MSNEIDRAILVLGGKINQAIRPEDALKISQSVLNMANAKAKLEELSKPPTRSKAS